MFDDAAVEKMRVRSEKQAHDENPNLFVSSPHDNTIAA